MCVKYILVVIKYSKLKSRVGLECSVLRQMADYAKSGKLEKWLKWKYFGGMY